MRERAVVFVYTDSTVCLGALIKYIVVLLSLSFRAVRVSRCLFVCLARDVCASEDVVSVAPPNERAKKKTRLALAERRASRRRRCCKVHVNVCVRACLCVCGQWLRCVMTHISRHTSTRCTLRGACFDVSSSIREQEMLSDDTACGGVRGVRSLSTVRGEWTCQSSSGLLYVLRGRLWPCDKECKARFNLAKSVFHLSLEQTGAGERKPYQPSV